LIMLENSLKGDIYYDISAMSVYNYGTTGSLSTKLNNKSKYKRLLSMYKSKFKFMNYVDKRTKFDFLFYTMIKRIRMAAGFFYQLLFK